ncbi:MAG: hypothetical protein MR316_00870 [Lachnospiraceae bacterium]|nr:hypothetical protein [Lachnospiraceae bacterium]
MCKIITFPTKKIEHTNGYKNLAALFEICGTVESCDFYLETVEDLAENGRITESEMFTLRRIGRLKRLELAQPAPQESSKANEPGEYLYTPEMEQETPDCQIEATHSCDGKHYILDTPLDLNGRGIMALDAHWITGCKKQIENWKSYRVTKKAFEKIKEQYTVSMECLLD